MRVTSQSNGGKGPAVRGRGQNSTPKQPSARESTLAAVRRLERLFAACEWHDQKLLARARKRASARALEVLETSGSVLDGGRTALLVGAAEMYGALRVELAARPQDAARVADEFEEVTGLSRIAL